MKKLILLLAAVATAMGANAQHYYPDATNPDLLRHTERDNRQRKEFILPQVNGYNVYKADLHTHSIFSDGSVTPEFRVQEAWHSGLDVMAVTEHVEYRPYEGKMINFLKGYVPDGTKAFNNSIIGKAADERGIQTDLNYAIKLAEAAAAGYGITIIPGTEITRAPETIGHYNALFTKDNNTIYDADPYKSIKKAKEQGAIVMQNHPGWRRTSLDMLEFEKKVYAEGLIDGIEIMNGSEFYPRAITRAQKDNFFMASNTDVHGSIAEEYTLLGQQRNMTLIFAKEQTLEALREALEAKRTLAYSCGTLAGEEQLLKDFFMASMKVRTIQKQANGNRKVAITNNSSVPYIIRMGNGNPAHFYPFSTITATIAKDGVVKITVESMWCGEDKHPVMEFK